MKKLFILFTLITALISLTCLSYAADYEEEATYLSELGILIVSENGFELDKEATRLEGLIMFLQLIGEEKYCIDKAENTTPFTDVPSWAYGYVNYAYDKGYTVGISSEKFGSNDLLDAKSYATLVLRALGYNDAEGDFSWSESLEMIYTKGIVNQEEYNMLKTKSFLRDDMALISKKVLDTKIKDEEFTMIELLVDLEVIDADLVNDDIEIIDDEIPEGANVAVKLPKDTYMEEFKAEYEENYEKSKYYSMEMEIIDLVNDERAKEGKEPLAWDLQLSGSANFKANDMALNNELSHTSPTYGTCFEQSASYGIEYSMFAENAAFGYNTASKVVNGWMKSSGHRENILREGVSKIGVGVAKASNGRLYITQQFTD